MAYLLDANVFISAKNLHYGFDFCPAFWDWLDHANGAGLLHSVERVYDELAGRDDDLSEWAQSRRPFFLSLNASDVRSVAAVNRWANDSRDYDPAAKAEFADVADSFILAQGSGRRSHRRDPRANQRRTKADQDPERRRGEWGAVVHTISDAADRARSFRFAGRLKSR